MDPNANLREQREIVAEVIRMWDSADPHTDYERELAQAADRLAELVQSLDEWLTNGGFLPIEWQS